MKLDTELKLFTETYDRAAITSIEDLSSNLKLSRGEIKFKLFNLKESFQLFQDYLRGYADYKIINKNNKEASPQNIICESVHKFIDQKLFKPEEIPVQNTANFIESYLTGVKELLSTVDDVKNSMMEADVDMEAVSDVNTFVDMFVESLHKSFDPSMDQLLQASGYYSAKKIADIFKKAPAKKAIFL